MDNGGEHEVQYQQIGANEQIDWYENNEFSNVFSSQQKRSDIQGFDDFQQKRGPTPQMRSTTKLKVKKDVKKLFSQEIKDTDFCPWVQENDSELLLN